MVRLLMSLAVVTALLGCGAAEPKWADEAAVAQARYSDGPPASVTLYTVISTKNGSGAHSGLLIDGAERIMFDPAGTWHHPRLPERNDVHYGITPKMQAFYIDYHARETYDVIEQTVIVPQEVADQLAARAKAYGAVPKAHCARSVSTILREVPYFADAISPTWFPKALSRDFATLPGASYRKITDDDADNNHGVLIVQQSDSDIRG